MSCAVIMSRSLRKFMALSCRDGALIGNTFCDHAVSDSLGGMDVTQLEKMK